MATEIKAGVYEAKVADYGVTKSKAGDPMVAIRFQIFDKEGDTHHITWYGSFKTPKSQEISAEALAVCGMKTKNFAELTNGAGSGVLDEKRIVSVTIASEEYQGKTRMKVKYINPPGGGGFRDKMNKSEAAQLFNGLNLAGVAAAAQKKHIKEIVNHAPKSEPPKMDTEEPIPF